MRWEVDDPLLAGSRQRVGTRSFGGWVEGVGEFAVETFEEVSVDVEDGPDRGVTEAGCDQLGVGNLSCRSPWHVSAGSRVGPLSW